VEKKYRTLFKNAAVRWSLEKRKQLPAGLRRNLGF
jgi:hypothetical protein